MDPTSNNPVVLIKPEPMDSLGSGPFGGSSLQKLAHPGAGFDGRGRDGDLMMTEAERERGGVEEFSGMSQLQLPRGGSEVMETQRDNR